MSAQLQSTARTLAGNVFELRSKEADAERLLEAIRGDRKTAEAEYESVAAYLKSIDAAVPETIDGWKS